MGRMAELAADIAIADQLREERPMSKEGLLLNLGFMAAELRRLILADRGCLSERQECQLMQIRMDLESAARLGGSIGAYIDGTAREPIARLLQAAE